MSVYVDDMEAPFGGMVMCHMVADTKEELLSMCDQIGVQRKWIQKEGTVYEHFDICLSKRKLAVRAGAREIDMHGLGLIFKSRREALRAHV
jgi:hypothetical protein